MWEDLPQKFSLKSEAKKVRACDVCERKVFDSIFSYKSVLNHSQVYLVSTRDEMRERIQAGECIAFDSLAFLGTKKKKLLPRFQVSSIHVCWHSVSTSIARSLFSALAVRKKLYFCSI